MRGNPNSTLTIPQVEGVSQISGRMTTFNSEYCTRRRVLFRIITKTHLKPLLNKSLYKNLYRKHSLSNKRTRKILSKRTKLMPKSHMRKNVIGLPHSFNRDAFKDNKFSKSNERSLKNDQQRLENVCSELFPCEQTNTTLNPTEHKI